jgi:ABC-type oligopeptide transport system substrate-binding subunit
MGFIPPSFPRDPAQFDNFLEHMSIGQVLETLVSADRNGDIIPGLAESWAGRDGGTTITFKIRPNVTFANGKALDPADVIYSIDRHRQHGHSQSRTLLDNIQSLEPLGGSVIMKLKRPQAAIFKILSRDQLGVVPAHWKFNAASNEPYTGTGAYRLVRESDHWYLERNSKYRAAKDVAIEKWRLLYQSAPGTAPSVMPDYCPLAKAEDIEKFKASGLIDTHYNVRDFLSFVQNSAWWYPEGKDYSNANLKRAKMAALRRLFGLRAEHLKAKRATGVIPLGVAGYLSEPVSFPINAPKVRNATPMHISVALHPTMIAEVFEEKDKSQVEAELGVKFDVLPLQQSKQARVGLANKPDIIIGRWAGGFNDPEGFLLIITEVIDMPLKEYLADLYPAFVDATSELSWTARENKFRNFNSQLVSEERLVPGWKTPLFSVLKDTLTEIPGIFRYTPRLTDVGFAK